MISVPAPVWRGGFVFRATVTAVAIGGFFGTLAWLDSGIWAAGVIVMVLVGVPYGIWMARRMARYWPGAQDLTGPDRVRVVHTARRGEPVGVARLAPAVGGYRDGLHAVAEEPGLHRYRWIIPVVLGVAAALALYDTVQGSTRDAVASTVYLGLIAVEVFWWPRRCVALLANADRAVAQLPA